MSTQETWVPLKRFGKVIPDYMISDQGRVRKVSTNEILKPYTTGQPDKGWAALCVGITIPRTDFFGEEYNYSSRKITVRIHKLVMESFRPIDEYPPIPKSDWEAAPESARQFIRESVLVDHINNDPLDNRLENLRWISALQNSGVRKKAKMLKDGIEIPEKREVQVRKQSTLEEIFE